MRRMPWLVSVSTRTLSGEMGDQKLGHPVPESYLASDWNKGVPQHTHL